MKKYIQLEKGTLVKDGTKYGYVLEVAEDFHNNKASNVRLRVIDEKPIIKKITTRYDPEIIIQGDKNASMDIVLGYDMEEINNSGRFLLYTLGSPFFFAGMLILADKLIKLPKSALPQWLIWVTIPLGIAASVLLVKLYINLNMAMFAGYLKARDLKKVLEKEGFKQ